MKKRTIIFLLVSIFLFLLIFFIALLVGRYSIGLKTFFKAIFTKDEAYDTPRNIVMSLRLPRTIVAGLTGIALGLSGLLFQEIFQNKLVSPDLLGVSAGSGVGAAFAIVLGLGATFVSLMAFAFGIFAVFSAIMISKIFRNKTSVMLLLSGIIVGGFMGAILSLIKYFANPETTLSSIIYWLMGSFANVTMKDVYILLPVVITCSILIVGISWRINIMALGKEEAQTKGINYTVYRLMFIGIATLLTATTVAFCGTIAWVGLVIPHIVRLISGKNTVRSVPLTIAFGGIFMIVVDIFSRSFTPDEIPLSAVTGFFGTLIFVVILIKNRSKFYEH